MKQSIAKLRLEYANEPLLSVDDDPIKQFKQWLKEAIKSEVFEPNGMMLSTVSSLGHPSSRMVLLKEIDRKGFVFFTSYSGRKGEQMEGERAVSLAFWWREIFRQVTVEGRVEKVSRATSCAYFAARPKGAQLAAAASSQSAPLGSREEIEERFRALKKRYTGKDVPCPKQWGGYRVIPHRFEFWQGQKNRLHDRFLYVKTNGHWTQTRLSP